MPPETKSPTSGLICYNLSDPPPQLRPAPPERDWMDQTPEAYAYRCLPLTIANGLGWEILCPAPVQAVWDGAPGLESVRIHTDHGHTDHGHADHGFAISHFGSGILTFQINGLFRTTAGRSLLVTGPLNRSKDGIAPLSGVVETDWSPFTFTMNWRFTRPGAIVAFEAGEPLAVILPIDLAALEAVEPLQVPIAANPPLQGQWQAWAESRQSFNAALGTPGTEAQRKKWQKHYHQGVALDGLRAQNVHRTKLRMKPFASSQV
jgi:Family of unknown function (DUF6065)